MSCCAAVTGRERAPWFQLDALQKGSEIVLQCGSHAGRDEFQDIQSRARDLDIMALHLEVERCNERAWGVYLSLGFSSTERFHLISRVL
jgi:hypothetical protein